MFSVGAIVFAAAVYKAGGFAPIWSRTYHLWIPAAHTCESLTYIRILLLIPAADNSTKFRARIAWPRRS